MTASPVLVLELVGPILSHAIRLARPHQLDQTQPLVRILNVLPRSYMPMVTDTAIMVMPWIDTEFACKIGNLWLLDTLHDHLASVPICRPVYFAADRALRSAADAGHVHVLDWWVARFGKLDADSDSAIRYSSCRSGNLDVLKWWMAIPRTNKQYGAASAIEMATKRGHIDILEYFRTNGFTFSYLTCSDPQDVILGQQLAVVKWWLKHDLLPKFPKQMSHYAMVACAVQGDRHTLDTLLATPDIQARFKDSEIGRVAAFTCATGDLEFIEHCHGVCAGGLTDPISYLVAGARGHLHVLDWLVAHNVPFGHVKLGDPDCRLIDQRMLKLGLSLMRRIALEFSPFFATIASGNIQVLDWFQAHSFAPNLEADKFALQFASAPTLDWVREHQPDLLALADVDACVQNASQAGDIRVLEWWASKVELKSKLTRPVSLHNAPIAAWEWWVKSGLPFHFHDRNDGAHQFDLPPPIEVCEWLLQNGHLPMWKLPGWIILVGHSAKDDRFLIWFKANGLIHPLFEMQEPQWPLNTSDGFLLTWPSLLWWMENGGPHFKSRVQQIPLSLTNPLKLDYIWKAYGKGNCVSLSGDRLSVRTGGHLVLKWSLQSGVIVHHKHAFKSATRGAQVDSNLEILDWWRSNLAQTRPAIPKARSVAKLCRGNEDVWKWWERSGLLKDIADVIEELEDILMDERPSTDSELDT